MNKGTYQQSGGPMEVDSIDSSHPEPKTHVPPPPPPPPTQRYEWQSGQFINVTLAHGGGFLRVAIMHEKSMRSNLHSKTLRSRNVLLRQWTSVMLTRPRGPRNSLG
eukprot:2886721-Karenia_brevis.AAC.1